MKYLRLAFLVVALAFVPLVAPLAAAPNEILLITATAATSDQTSRAVVRPKWATGIIVIINVTAGAVLLLDVNLAFYSSGLDFWFNWVKDCPSAEGITGASTTTCLFHPAANTSIDGNENVTALPQVFRVFVDHGNETAATYTVRSQWVRR